MKTNLSTSKDKLTKGRLLIWSQRILQIHTGETSVAILQVVEAVRTGQLLASR